MWGGGTGSGGWAGPSSNVPKKPCGMASQTASGHSPGSALHELPRLISVCVLPCKQTELWV